MAMSVGGSGDTFCDINTTPLIDVMLVLLVTLIVTLPIMTHAVKLDMPDVTHPPPPPPTPPEVIDLEIDFDGTVVWNGTPVTGFDQLEGFFRAERDKEPQPEIHLRPDRRAKYDIVARVLAGAQRNHMKKIGFVNVAEFKD
jgi:biopolymer transport protein ExbD